MRLLILALAVLQIFAPFLINPFSANGASRAEGGPPSLIEPAAYAFAVWGVIYLGALIYAVWQITPSGRAEPLTAKAAGFAIALYLGSTLWLAAAKYGPLWATIPLILVMAVSAIVVTILVGRSVSFGSATWWFMLFPFAVYAGWTTCATFVNFAEVAPQYGFDRFGLSTELYGSISLVVAAVIALSVLWFSRGQSVYAATVAWALIGILVAARTRDYGDEVTLTASAALAALAVTFIAFRLRFTGSGAT